MLATAVTISTMSKSKGANQESPKPKRGRPAAGRKPSYPLFCRIKPRIGQALEAYLATARPEPDKTAVVEYALEKLLAELGFWPPPPE